MAISSITRLASLQKVPCSHCGNHKTRPNIRRHEAKCHLNLEFMNSIKKCCLVCSKDFYSSAVTCSYACSNRQFGTSRKKKNRIISYKEIALKHHEHRCIICGEDKIISIHHVNEIHEDNLPENLVVLCPTHHQYYHSRYRLEVEPKIIQYVKAFISSRL